MIRRYVAALCAVLVLAAAPASADDSGLNKEGFWTVGRGDAQSKSCMASIIAKDGTMFLIQVEPGHVDVVVGTQKRMRQGKVGVLMIDATRFDFTPEYADGRNMMFFEDAGQRALAALRGARAVTVQVDGRELLDASLEGSGADGALDAAVACSKGESGWWGPGVGATVAAAPSAAKGERVLNKEGYWFIEADAKEPLCTAVVPIEGGGAFVLVTGGGAYSFGVGGDAKLQKGRKGRFETDAFGFDFKPGYKGKDYLYADGELGGEAVAALRQAKTIRIAVDDRPVADMVLEGTGHAQVMTDLEDCSRGRSGWWGRGAPQP